MILNYTIFNSIFLIFKKNVIILLMEYIFLNFNFKESKINKKILFKFN
jgi:hypothetical protein